MITEEQIQSIGAVLNSKHRPLKERFRALFTLKNIGGVTAIDEISRAFSDDSALLKHELAYCLGQMQDKQAIHVLTYVLSDKRQEPIVRHEAAEALGAIGAPEVLPILERFKNDPVEEVAQTCDIACERVKWLLSGEKVNDNNPYNSIDPAPPIDNACITTLTNIFLDPKRSLFERYRAMFSLRNLGTEAAILVLTEGLRNDSALFRHEVAFVLGQLQHPASIPYLKANLADPLENEMVRHECAEALGAIATEECTQILRSYIKDEKRVVKESCEIALDLCEYENSPEFQYANGLTKLQQ